MSIFYSKLFGRNKDVKDNKTKSNEDSIAKNEGEMKTLDIREQEVYENLLTENKETPDFDSIKIGTQIWMKEKPECGML